MALRAVGKEVPEPNNRQRDELAARRRLAEAARSRAQTSATRTGRNAKYVLPRLVAALDRDRDALAQLGDELERCGSELLKETSPVDRVAVLTRAKVNECVPD